MKTNYPSTNILEYIPSRYVGLNAKQQQNRRTVWSFKDGFCSDEIKRNILQRISAEVTGNAASWVVCFIPASTQEKTSRRYSGLSTYLRSNLACEVRLDAITIAYDTVAGHLSGKDNNPTDNMVFNHDVVNGKRVILIDDVITRGVTFNFVANKLVLAGAISVYGIFLAKTIHPDLPIGKLTTKHHTECEWMYENDLADAEVLSEIIHDEIAQEEEVNVFVQDQITDAIVMNEILQEEIAEQDNLEDAIGCEGGVYDTQTFLEVSGLSWSDIM